MVLTILYGANGNPPMMPKCLLQRCKYYLLVGVMAYLSLAYYIHFQFQPSRTYHWSQDLDDAWRESSPLSVHNLAPNFKMLEKNYDFMNIGDYSNYYGPDYNISVDGKLWQTQENMTNELNFEAIQFNMVNFRNIEQIYVYGAYLDQRIVNKTVVRIFALQRLKDLESLICVFNGKHGFLPLFTEKYEMCENHGKKYGGYIYSCQLPESTHKVPTSITVSTISGKYSQNPHHLDINLISLQQSDLQFGKMFFGVCLPPLFGNIPLNILVQYIEMTKILGGSKLFFYKYNVSKSVEKLLRYYTARGDVEVLDWTMPKVLSHHDIWYNGQLLAIQHCLYRNMARFQFLLFADLDEVLIPRHAANWFTMLHNVVANADTNLSHVAAFSFQSVFFDPKQIPDAGETLRLLQQLDRTNVTSALRSKLLVQPSHVFELGIHHLSKSIDDSMTVMDVNPDDALLHHYRSCVLMFDSKMRCYPTVRDEIILKYSKLLNIRTNSIMSYISRVFM